LRQELHPRGLEIVTVCLDMAGAEAARPFVAAARPEHPTLLDVNHRIDALFGVVNIPNGIWIDETGTIVRPPEPAWPAPRPAREPREAAEAEAAEPAAPEPPASEPPAPDPPVIPERVKEMLAVVGRSTIDRTRYEPAVRDWVEHGAASRFVLSPDEVVRRSQPRGEAEAAGAAHFELAEHLWARGRRDAARHHFRAAHRLQPDNWTYKRQAWSIEPAPAGGGMERYWQGPMEGEEETWPYEGDFLTDVIGLQGRDYYPVPEDMNRPTA
jgi:hypothetical protein